MQLRLRRWIPNIVFSGKNFSNPKSIYLVANTISIEASGTGPQHLQWKIINSVCDKLRTN